MMIAAPVDRSFIHTQQPRLIDDLWELRVNPALDGFALKPDASPERAARLAPLLGPTGYASAARLLRTGLTEISATPIKPAAEGDNTLSVYVPAHDLNCVRVGQPGPDYHSTLLVDRLRLSALGITQINATVIQTILEGEARLQTGVIILTLHPDDIRRCLGLKDLSGLSARLLAASPSVSRWQGDSQIFSGMLPPDRDRRMIAYSHSGEKIVSVSPVPGGLGNELNIVFVGCNPGSSSPGRDDFLQGVHELIKIALKPEPSAANTYVHNARIESALSDLCDLSKAGKLFYIPAHNLAMALGSPRQRG